MFGIFKAIRIKEEINSIQIENHLTEQSNQIAEIREKIDKFEKIKLSLAKFNFIVPPSGAKFKNDQFGLLIQDGKTVENKPNKSPISNESTSNEQERDNGSCKTCR